MKCTFCSKPTDNLEVCDLCKKYLMKPETGLPIMRAHITALCPDFWPANYKKAYVDKVMNVVAKMKPRN